MLDLNFWIGAGHIDLVVTPLHMARKVRKGKLAAQKQRQVLKEGLKANRSDRSLKEGPSVGSVRKPLQTALARQNGRSVFRLGKCCG